MQAIYIFLGLGFLVSRTNTCPAFLLNSCKDQMKQYIIQKPLGNDKALHSDRLCNLLTEINFTLEERENVGYCSLTIVTFMFQVVIFLLILILLPHSHYVL